MAPSQQVSTLPCHRHQAPWWRSSSRSPQAGQNPAFTSWNLDGGQDPTGGWAETASSVSVEQQSDPRGARVIAKIEITGDTAVNISEGGSVEIRLDELVLHAQAEHASGVTAIELIDRRPAGQTSDDPLVAINGGQSIWLVPLSKVPEHWRDRPHNLALPDRPELPSSAEA